MGYETEGRGLKWLGRCRPRHLVLIDVNRWYDWVDHDFAFILDGGGAFSSIDHTSEEGADHDSNLPQVGGNRNACSYRTNSNQDGEQGGRHCRYSNSMLFPSRARLILFSFPCPCDHDLYQGVFDRSRLKSILADNDIRHESYFSWPTECT